MRTTHEMVQRAAGMQGASSSRTSISTQHGPQNDSSVAQRSFVQRISLLFVLKNWNKVQGDDSLHLGAKRSLPFSVCNHNTLPHKEAGMAAPFTVVPEAMKASRASRPTIRCQRRANSLAPIPDLSNTKFVPSPEREDTARIAETIDQRHAESLVHLILRYFSNRHYEVLPQRLFPAITSTFSKPRQIIHVSCEVHRPLRRPIQYPPR